MVALVQPISHPREIPKMLSSSWPLAVKAQRIQRTAPASAQPTPYVAQECYHSPSDLARGDVSQLFTSSLETGLYDETATLTDTAHHRK